VTSTKETFIPRVTKEEDVLLQSVLFSTLSRRFTIKWQKLLPSTDMYDRGNEDIADVFLDNVIAAKKAGFD